MVVSLKTQYVRLQGDNRASRDTHIVNALLESISFITVAIMLSELAEISALASASVS